MFTRKILLVVFLVSASALKAQIQFGLKAGVSIANLRSHNRLDLGRDPGRYYFHENVVGPAGSVYADIELNPKVKIQPEIGYYSFGCKNDVPNDFETRLNYISIPISLKYAVDKVSIFAGPYVSFLLNSKEYPGFYELDCGAHAGIEFSVYKNLGVGARYLYGFKNLDRNETSIPALNPIDEMNNRALQLYVLFSLPKK